MIRQVLVATVFLMQLSCAKKTESETTGLNNLPTIETIQSAVDSVEQNCSYENAMSELGLGVVIAPSTFEVFNDSLLVDKFGAFDMYTDEGKMRLCPLYYKPDYGIMHFVVVSENVKSYRVLTKTTEYKFLPKSGGYTFRNWADYIKGSFGIRRKPDQKQALRRQPSEKSEELTIPENMEMFCPMKLQGEWLEVEWDCKYNSINYEGQPCHDYINQCNNATRGWLKWREGNALLIDVFLMP